MPQPVSHLVVVAAARPVRVEGPSGRAPVSTVPEVEPAEVLLYPVFPEVPQARLGGELGAIRLREYRIRAGIGLGGIE